MIKASDLPKMEPPKLDVEAKIKEIEQDAIKGRLSLDGRFYELPYDIDGMKKIKNILETHGYEALTDLMGNRGGTPLIGLFVGIKKS